MQAKWDVKKRRDIFLCKRSMERQEVLSDQQSITKLLIPKIRVGVSSFRCSLRNSIAVLIHSFWPMATIVNVCKWSEKQDIVRKLYSFLILYQWPHLKADDLLNGEVLQRLIIDWCVLLISIADCYVSLSCVFPWSLSERALCHYSTRYRN